MLPPADGRGCGDRRGDRHHQARAARVAPRALREPPEAIFGTDRDVIRIHGDVVAPLDVGWEAEVDPDRVLDP